MAPSAGSGDATQTQTTGTPTGDFDVRKIVYNATLTLTADNPEAALDNIVQKTQELGGYISDSYTTTDDLGATLSTATLKVPADMLEELVTAAEAAALVDAAKRTAMVVLV